MKMCLPRLSPRATTLTLFYMLSLAAIQLYVHHMRECINVFAKTSSVLAIIFV